LSDFETVIDKDNQQILKSYFSTPKFIDDFQSDTMGYQHGIITENLEHFGYRELKASCLPIPEKKLKWIH